MRRVLLLLLGGAGLALSALAQQSAEPVPAGNASDPAATGTAAEASADAVTDDTAEAEAEPVAEPEPKIDDVYYQDVDDKDFRPSEDIPADQSIPFPSDI